MREHKGYRIFIELYGKHFHYTVKNSYGMHNYNSGKDEGSDTREEAYSKAEAFIDELTSVKTQPNSAHGFSEGSDL